MGPAQPVRSGARESVDDGDEKGGLVGFPLLLSGSHRCTMLGRFRVLLSQLIAWKETNHWSSLVSAKDE